MSEKHPQQEIHTFSKGFKVNPETGGVDRLEYSVWLEQAEELMNQAGAIKTEIKRLENQPLPERSEMSAETLAEIWGELDSCEKIIRDWRTSQRVKDKLTVHITKLEAEIPIIETRLGLPDLQNQVHSFVAAAKELIEKDRLIEKELRNMTEGDFKAVDV